MVAALSFYLERICTYTYFAPVITDIGSNLANGVAISQLLPDLEQWARLNWIRTVVGDGSVFASLLLVAFTPCGLHSKFWLSYGNESTQKTILA
jgi:hypothetical protein